MKKAIFAALIVMVASSFCFAQEAKTEAKAGMPVVEQAKTLIGKIVSVTIADPAKGVTEGVVEVTDEVGKTTTVTVKESVNIVDGALNAVTLNQLKAGDAVEVKHATKDGKEEAESIAVK